MLMSHKVNILSKNLNILSSKVSHKSTAGWGKIYMKMSIKMKSNSKINIKNNNNTSKTRLNKPEFQIKGKNQTKSIKFKIEW